MSGRVLTLSGFETDVPGGPGSQPLRSPDISSVESSRRLHVLHVSALAEGDIATLTLDYVRDQVERGWGVTVVCPSRGPLGYATREQGAGVRWWVPPAPVAADERAGWADHVDLLHAVRRLRGVVDDVRPDVVHLHGARAGRAGRLAVRNRVPTVYQPHGRLPGTLRPRPGRRGVTWEHWAARWTGEVLLTGPAELARARRCGVIPAETAETAGTSGPGQTVVGCGVDVTRWRACGPGDRDAARARLGLRPGPLVVCVARVTALEGQRDLVAAWDDVLAQVPRARLVLVGDGPDADVVAGLVARTSRAALVEARSDAATWWAAADVIVMPRRAGGTPLRALQAMASARSLVVTDAGVDAEVVPAGAGGTVATGDLAGLAAAIVLRLRDPALADEEGWQGRRHVERHHDCVDTAREVARTYPRLVAARRT